MSKRIEIDKRTTAELEKMSKSMNKSIDEVISLLTWVGRQAIGRKVTIEEPKMKSKVTLSLTKFKKVAKLDVKE